MSNKSKIVIAAFAGVLLIIAVVVFLNKPASNDSNPESGNNSGSSVIGTWYSDKPDMITFTEDGKYQAASWNGGNAWLSSGTYAIEGNTLTLTGSFDGTTVLTIDQSKENNKVIKGKYTYYDNENAAKKAIQTEEEQSAEDKANIVPDTVNKLLGEWVSLDGTTTCTFTDKSFTVHFLGSDAAPEETLEYEYEVLNDKQMKITENGNQATYSYKLYEENGVWYFVSPVKSYASTYQKADKQSTSDGNSAAAGTPVNPQITDRVISSEKNPDMSQYAEELNTYVKENIVGIWKGTFEEHPASTSYWSYEFKADGTYSFSNGNATESGQYSITSDPNENYYHSSLKLTFEGGERTVKFYFTTTNPMKMITEDQTDPTFLKQ